MRSGLIFKASARITNRYLLCRMLSASARKMHRDGVSTSQCINNSLLALQEPTMPEAKPVSEAKPSPTPDQTTVTEGKEAEALVP